MNGYAGSGIPTIQGGFPILTPPGASADASGDTASEQLFQKCSDWAKIWLNSP